MCVVPSPPITRSLVLALSVALILLNIAPCVALVLALSLSIALVHLNFSPSSLSSLCSPSPSDALA